jgi:outer membrane protein OmpA-like peptidoglycan-associated protein
MLPTRAFVVVSVLMLAIPVFAQTVVPSAEQMVEQLKKPRTRSLRNLTIEAVPQAGGPHAAANASDTSNASPPAADAQSSGPEVAPVRPSLSLSIQFDFDSSRIRPESLVALGNLAAALNSAALLPSKFVIEGHTDAKGSADYNRKLSDQRAVAVKDLLVAKGIAGERLLSVGKGATELANPAAPQSAENRRVKIVNLD